MPYTKRHENWSNLPSTATPVNADALEHMEEGISDATDVAEAAASEASSAAGGLAAHLIDPSDAHAAEAISVADAGARYTATNVESVLAELHDEIESGGYQPGGTDVAVTDGGTGASVASDARFNLGLEIGVDVQAYSSDLDNIPSTYVSALKPEAYGAVGDGVTDDTSAFENMIDDIATGSFVHLDSTATYLITAPLTISGVDDWQWIGGRFLFDCPDASDDGAESFLTVTGCSGFLLEGVDVTVENQAQEHNGIMVTACDTAMVRRCKVYNARWSGIAVYDATADTSFDITVTECTSLRCRFGIFSNGLRSRIISNVASSQWTQTQEYIDDAGVWDSSSLYYDGILVGGSGWQIVNNTLTDNGQSGIYAGGETHSGLIQGNVVIGNHNKGIDLGTVGAKSASNRIYGVTISGNVVIDNATGNIHGRHLDDSVIVGNTSSITDAGISAATILLNGNCDRNVIHNNVCTSESATVVLFIDSTDGAADNVVMANTVTGSTRFSLSTTANMVLDTQTGSTGATFTSLLKVGTAVSLDPATGELIYQRAKVDGAAGAGYLEFQEQSSNPSSPSANRVRVFMKDNGTGAGQVAAKFSDGSVHEFSELVGMGAPKASGGTRYVGVPGAVLGSAATRSQTINQSRYYPFVLREPVEVDQWLFEVTTAPASNANVRVGLTAADEDWQPTGAPIFDVSEAVASGFTGVKSASVGPHTLTPGLYMLRSNCDVTMTLRSYVLPAVGTLAPTLGATAHAEFFLVSETFGAMTSPAADWTGAGASGNGPATPIFLRWTDPVT